MPIMNKSERRAYDWLASKGHKEILFRSITPDFKTDKGWYEVKRGYLTKAGNIKILFTHGQRDKIKDRMGFVLIFMEGPEPVDIIKPDEIYLNKVRNIILYDTDVGGRTMYIRFDLELLEKMDRIIKIKGYDSRASFVRKAVFDKLNQEEGRFLA